MPTFNLEPPSLLRVPDALRATSNSSASLFTFDQRSKTSQFTESLITPLGSIDSIFGNNPQVEPVPSRFPDLVPCWQGMTDEQWNRHSLVSKAEYPIKEAEIRVFKDLDNTFFRDDIWYNDDFYDHDEEFDAMAAVRTRFVKGEQTIITRHGPEIIDARFGLAATLIADDERSMPRRGVVEQIEGYDEVPLHRDSILETIKEVGKDREQDSLFNVTFPSPPRYATNFLPPTPLIRPVDVVWDSPPSDTSVSTPKYISQLLMSPLVLDNLAIFHDSFGNINPIHNSPIIISPFLFSSRRPLPTLDVTPQVQQEFGLGLVDVPRPTSMTQDAGTDAFCAVPFVAKSPQYESQQSHIISEESPLYVEDETLDNSSDHKPLYDALSFGPALSPLDKMLEGLGQRVVAYVPTTLGSSIPHTASSVVYAAMNTVTAGCSHPAASTSFVAPTMEASRAQKGMKGLGLGLPIGLKQRVSRCSSGIPTSEACQDLASLAAAPVSTNSRPRGFRGRMLSPIPEVDGSAQLDPCPTHETRPLPSPTRQRNVFKRALKLLF